MVAITDCNARPQFGFPRTEDKFENPQYQGRRRTPLGHHQLDPVVADASIHISSRVSITRKPVNRFWGHNRKNDFKILVNRFYVTLTGN